MSEINLSPAQKTLLRTLIALAADSEDGQTITESTRNLAERTGLSVGSVVQAKQVLEEVGLIEIEERREGRRTYHVLRLLGREYAEAVLASLEANEGVQGVQSSSEPEHSASRVHVQLTEHERNLEEARSWVVEGLLRADPSMPEITAASLAASAFYAPLVASKAYLDEFIKGQAMHSPLTKALLRRLAREIEACLAQAIVKNGGVSQ